MGYSAFHLGYRGMAEARPNTRAKWKLNILLLVSELHVDVAHRGGDGVQHFFPLCPIPENGESGVCIRFVELVSPIFKVAGIVEQLAREQLFQTMG